jgi:hypothetical protein
MTKRLCVNCKHSRGVGFDFWCGEGHIEYERYLAETDCPYFEGMGVDNDSTNSRNKKRYVQKLAHGKEVNFVGIIDHKENVYLNNEKTAIRLNQQDETINQLEKRISHLEYRFFEYRNKKKILTEEEVKETLQKHYDDISKRYVTPIHQRQGKTIGRELMNTQLALLEQIAEELGVDLE